MTEHNTQTDQVIQEDNENRGERFATALFGYSKEAVDAYVAEQATNRN